MEARRSVSASAGPPPINSKAGIAVTRDNYFECLEKHGKVFFMGDTCPDIQEQKVAIADPNIFCLTRRRSRGLVCVMPTTPGFITSISGCYAVTTQYFHHGSGWNDYHVHRSNSASSDRQEAL